MAGGNPAVFGVYPARERAEQALELLASLGVNPEAISVLLPTVAVRASSPFGAALSSVSGLGALAIPGAGPFIAGGPLRERLSGLSASEAELGLLGALTGMGIPEYEARLYDDLIRNGGVLLCVHCASSTEIDSAKEILRNSGAESIASAADNASNLSEVA